MDRAYGSCLSEWILMESCKSDFFVRALLECSLQGVDRRMQIEI